MPAVILASVKTLAIVHAYQNDPMLNILLNTKNNCSMKRIENQGMSFNSLWIPTFVV